MKNTERRENAVHIVESIKNFMNSKSYKNNDVNTYNIIVAGASGGSGNMIAAMLVKHLLNKDIPVLMVLIGDSSNELYTINTLNTIATFDGMAKKAKKPLNIMYFDNAKADELSNLKKLESVDKHVFKTLSILSAFLSGDLSELDQKDMSIFIDPSSYSTINIESGLYGLKFFSRDIQLPKHVTPKLCRTMGAIDGNVDVNVDFKHHKFGVTDNQNVIETYNGHFPIHLVTYSNSFSIVEMELKNRIEDFRKKAKLDTVDNVTGANDEEADDDGFVF